NAYSFFLGGGLYLGTGNWIVTPTAGIQYSYMTTEAYAENGAGDLNLQIDENTTDSFLTKLGMTVGYMVTDYLRADLRAAWTHECASLDRSSKAQFSTIGATQFEVNALTPDTNMYSLGTGIIAQLEEDMELTLDYNYDLSDTFEAHTISAGLRIDF
ncbi:MAG: autotransporter outer membrane beta-barrel domain-containing protein, partial [Planctomycetes bacterium]|nr:autotransporter outer membrane beta-barrel domain-containing protein [Planctomycetota bacterium]